MLEGIINNIGALLAILISIATLIGFLTANARAKGRMDKAVEDMECEINILKEKVDEQYSQRNATNTALTSLSSAFKENMDWIKDALKEVKDSINDMRKERSA
jgi:hypothetical protein